MKLKPPYLSLCFVVFLSVLCAQDKKTPGTTLQTKSYRVPEHFAAYLHTMTLPEGNDQTNETAPHLKSASIQTTLETIGLPFPKGSEVNHNAKHSTLKVTHTESGIELVEEILESIRRNADQHIHIYQEWIEVDHILFSDWLFENRLNDNGTQLRQKTQEWIKQGKAVIVDSVIVSGESEVRSKTESGEEYIYPTEYDPAEVPSSVTLKNGAEAPVTAVNPTAFETRLLGTRLEVEPVLRANGKIVDLNLASEIVRLKDVIHWHHQQTDNRFQTKLPVFHTQKITTQVKAVAGRYTFLGTTRPMTPTNPKITENPIILQFVRADVNSSGDWSLLNEE